VKTTEQEPTTDIDQQLVRELKDGDIHPTTARIIELIGKNSENPAESTTGIIPGDRGKEGGSWCRPPLPMGNHRVGKITSSSGQCHDCSSDMNQELSGQARIRNRVQAESGRREVSTRRPDAVTQRVTAATAQTRTQTRIPAGKPKVPPPKGPGRLKTAGARKGDVIVGSERDRQIPSNLLD